MWAQTAWEDVRKLESVWKYEIVKLSSKFHEGACFQLNSFHWKIGSENTEHGNQHILASVFTGSYQ